MLMRRIRLVRSVRMAGVFAITLALIRGRLIFLWELLPNVRTSLPLPFTPTNTDEMNIKLSEPRAVT